MSLSPSPLAQQKHPQHHRADRSAEQRPLLAVELRKLRLLHRGMVVRSRVQGDAGQQQGQLQVLDVSILRQVIQEQDIRIAIVAVPANEAQAVADSLV